MKILAVDTSSKAASCAYIENGVLIYEIFANLGHTHSETILPMIEDLLRRTGKNLSNLDCYAVSAGPGSFTGLRIGLATVKGLALPRNTKVIPVSTLEALGRNVEYYTGLIVPVMDARRQQVYTAVYKMVEGNFTEVLAPTTLLISELQSFLEPYKGDTPPMLVGDGADLVQSEVEWTVKAPSALLHQRASSVGAAALASLECAVSPSELVPIYLRITQAERELRDKSEV